MTAPIPLIARPKSWDGLSPREMLSYERTTDDGEEPLPPGGVADAFVVVPLPIFDGNGMRMLLAQPDAATDYRFKRPKYDASWADQMRLTADVETAGATNAELFAEHSGDGSAWAEPGVGATPVAVLISAAGPGKVGPWVTMDPAAIADRIWRVRARSGNGVLSPVVAKVHAQFRRSEVARPTPPAGPLGNIIHDLNAETLVGMYSDEEEITTWPDDSFNGFDGTATGLQKPVFDLTGWDGTLPCVKWGGSTGRITFTPPTNSQFTHYIVASNIDGGDVANIIEGDGYPRGKSVTAIGTSQMGAQINTHVWFPTHENVLDTWDMSQKHIYRFVFHLDAGEGHWYLFVDGVLVADNLCPPQITESATMWIGDALGGLGMTMHLAREVCYDQPHITEGKTSVEDELSAFWGTP